MFNLRDISIRNKLILMQVFTSVLVLGTFISVFLITDIKSYKKRKADSMIGLAQVTGANSISTLQFNDVEAATQILSELHNGAPDIIHAVILDQDGKVFASYSRKDIPDSLHIPTSLRNRDYFFTKDRLFVSNSIVANTKPIGKVVLEVELSELHQMTQEKYALAAILLFGSIGFAFLVALIVQRYISKRLINLARVMRDVSKTGDYNRSISGKGHDEISTLIKMFNNLMMQVKENQQRKDEFISIASHELKTPLTSIKGYLELLKEIENEEPNKQFVAKSLDNVSKLEKLIRDLLDVSKIQSGQLKLEKKEFNIDLLLDETIASMQMVTSSHEIVREDHLNNENVIGDKQRIEQVLTNLLSNAVKYSPGQNKVIVHSKKINSEIIIKIRDFGIGIPTDEQQNIFQRFYRTKDMPITITGFGLGLYICKDIIERHKGKIWVETEEKGSAFYFSLPLSNGIEHRSGN